MKSHIQEPCCNVCGKPLDIFDRQAAFGIHNERIGYGSIHDGETCNLDFCCTCFDRMISSLRFAITPFSDDLEYISESESDDRPVPDGRCG